MLPPAPVSTSSASSVRCPRALDAPAQFPQPKRVERQVQHAEVQEHRRQQAPVLAARVGRGHALEVEPPAGQRPEIREREPAQPLEPGVEHHDRRTQHAEQDAGERDRLRAPGARDPARRGSRGRRGVIEAEFAGAPAREGLAHRRDILLARHHQHLGAIGGVEDAVRHALRPQVAAELRQLGADARLDGLECRHRDSVCRARHAGLIRRHRDGCPSRAWRGRCRRSCGPAGAAA